MTLGNQEDAHKWRSETLRLLMPPEQNNTEAERRIRHNTKSDIAAVADRKASDFFAGPARHLIDRKSGPDAETKLFKIFNDAAEMAYMLCTRRTNMMCVTLGQMEARGFEAENLYFDPDALVRHDEHDDGLKGRPIMMVVHPLLLVYGTDEAKDYDKERVWIKGVVWLDSTKTKTREFED